MAYQSRRRGLQPPHRRSRLFDYALTLALLGALTAVVLRLQNIETIAQAGVPIIIDGDSLQLNGERLRLKGIDAPELGQMCSVNKMGMACGQEARSRLRGFIGTDTVACKGWQRDKYQRLLVICAAGGREVNRQMVRSGWAVAYGGYQSEEAAARSEKLGLWAGGFERPQDWRRMRGGLTEGPHDFWSEVWDYVLRILARDKGGST